jgi:hypothetical protein
MLFVFNKLGWNPEKISVSPFAGVPTKPQLALLFQLASAPPPPDQLKVAARLATMLESPTAAITATAANRLAKGRGRVEYDVKEFVLFMFFILNL